MNSLIRFSVCSLVIFLVSSVVGQDENEQSEDTGDNSIFAALRTEVDRQLNLASDKLPVVQRVSLARGLERKIKSMGPMSSDNVSKELLGVAEYFWQNRAHDQATRLYKEIGDSNPGSINGARAYMMQGWIEYGNRMDPEKAVEPFSKAVKILEGIPGEDNFSRDDLMGRTRVTLGDSFLILERDDEAIEQYDAFLSDEGAVKMAEQSTIMNANLEWARLLVKKGELDAARKRYEILNETIKGFDVVGPTETAVLREILGSQLSTMTPEEQFFALEEIWFGDPGKSSIQSIYVINELCLRAYFSKSKENRDKFPELASELLTASVAAKDKNNKLVLSRSQGKDVYSIVQQTRLMNLELFEKKKQRKEFALELESFFAKYETFNRPRFTPHVPTRLPSEFTGKIMDLHKKFILPRIKAMKQKEQSEEFASVLEDPGESISFEKLPFSLSVKEKSTEVPVKYVAEKPRDIVVEFWKNEKWFAGGETTVENGDGVAKIKVQFPKSFETGGFQIKASLRPLKGDWKKSIQSIVRNDYAVIKEKVSFEEKKRFASHQIEFGVKYEAADSRDIVIELRKGETWVGGKTQTIEGGVGRVSMTVNAKDIPSAGDGYTVKLSLRPVGTEWTENISLVEENVKILNGE